MIGLSWLGCIICELVASNSYLDFSLISIDSNCISLPMREVLVSWGQNCRLLVVDSLPRTANKHRVTNWWFKKKKKKKIQRHCWMKSSSHSSVSHIVVNHLVKRPLSIVRAVPELDPMVRTTTKEWSECRADSQGVGLSRVHWGVDWSSSRA